MVRFSLFLLRGDQGLLLHCAWHWVATNARPYCLFYHEASVGLHCRPPPACGGAPGAVHVWFADYCFIL